MAPRGASPRTGLQKQLGAALASLRDAGRVLSRLLKLQKSAAASVKAAESALRQLAAEEKLHKQSKGRRGRLPRPGQLAALRQRRTAAKAESKRVALTLVKARKEERRLRTEIARLTRIVDAEKAGQAKVRQKENQRHRQIHRRLDVEEMNKRLVPELHRPLPAWPGPRPYAWPELSVVSWWVCEWMKANLEPVAEQIGGHSFVFRNTETLSVDGRLIFLKPDETEMGELVSSVADLLRRMTCELTPLLGEDRRLLARRSSLYYHETFFQAAVTIYTDKHGFTSPGDRSKVLPGGLIETEFDGDWTSESADHALQVLEAIYDSLMEAGEEREEEFQLGRLELRFHWNPMVERPERARPPAEQNFC
jgi:hypothetical protein